MLKKIYNTVRTSLWLYPTLYSLVALALAVAVAWLDRYYTMDQGRLLPGFFYTSTSLAETVLGIVAGAFITIATFTFSTTMVVLTMYSSQFTPRVVENFLNNQTTMKSFGIFLSGFIYAIMSLLFISGDKEKDLVIAASVGVVYIIVGLVYFLIFVQNVSTHIQASGLMRRLHKEADGKIEQYLQFLEESEVVPLADMEALTARKSSLDVPGDADGYIQEISYPRLLRAAEDGGFTICFRKVVGQFVTREIRMLTLYYDAGEGLDEAAVREVQHCVLIGNKKTESQDFSFTIQKIVEIALKALSPGINDPNTAIHCLQIIGLLLRELASIDKGYVLLKGEEKGFILYEAYDFDMLLYDAYNQIFHYGNSDASVMTAIFKSLRYAKAKASQENLRLIDSYAHGLFSKVAGSSFTPLEYSKILKEYKYLFKLSEKYAE